MLLNPLCLINLHFHLFLSSCQIYQNLPFLHIYIYIYICVCVCVRVCEKARYLKGDISTLNGSSLKLVGKFTYQGSSVSSTKIDIDTQLAEAWTTIDRISVIWKSDLTNKMTCSFLQAAVVLTLIYGCTTWMLTKRMQEKLESNYTRMLLAIFNKSWRQHPTKQQLYGYLSPIMKTIKIRRTRHAGHCSRSRDELISDVLLWTSSNGQTKAGQPAWICIQQLCAKMGCSPEDLPEAMDYREGWRERVRDIFADSTTWWW